MALTKLRISGRSTAMLILAVMIGLSCGGSPDEQTASTQSPLAAACGNQGILAWSGNGSYYLSLGSERHVLVPATVNVVSANVQAGDSIWATFTVEGGYCTYGRTQETGLETNPLPLTICTNALSAGSPTTTSYLELSAGVTQPGVESAQVEADVDFNADDGDPCTVDKCVNGVIDNSELVPAGTVIGTSLLSGRKTARGPGVTSTVGGLAG